MSKSVLDTPELEEIEKKAHERVMNEANDYLHDMAIFHNSFAPFEQALNEAFGKRDIEWKIMSIKRKEK